MKKKCTACGKEKGLDCFSTNGTTTLSDGSDVVYYKSKCKTCHTAAMTNIRRSNPNAYLMNQWSKIRQRCEGRAKYIGMKYPGPYSYVNWAMDRDDFNKHFKLWVESGFDMQKSPSIDRIDVSKGYTFDNMQFISFAENSIKDRYKPIIMSYGDTQYTFSSRTAAKNATNLSYKSLYKLINGQSDNIKGWSVINA